MILFFYNLALLVALVVGSPWWLFRMATTSKYRKGLGQRLGWVRSLYDIASKGHSPRPLIWIHAVSVGEVLAISRLVHELDAALPAHFISISTTTRTGQQLAIEHFGAERVFYCPLDLPWAVRAYLKALQPQLLVLAETEFWPNLLTGCFRRGIPVAVVNARISDRSWPRYRALRCLWQPLLRPLAQVLAQTSTDAERLCAIGCQRERVQISGNLKFDIRVTTEAAVTRLLKAPAHNLRIIVAGSTLEGEESALIALWPALTAAHPDLLLVLAPRHPERFAAVATLLTRSKIPWQQRSTWELDTTISLRPGQIILLDSIGELSSVYSLASVAFVGGSLVPAGGHNPLEPAQFAVPIVMGSHYANFRAIVEELIAQNAIRIVQPAQLSATLSQLLGGDVDGGGTRAQEVFARQAGATQRTVRALKKLLVEEAL